ncbi:MAG: PTS glucose transporter subunit IIA [Schwartzia sp.]|nr:PTS glucose transporter subunit IIA [Schwartzia sp. (in: firmicutes)]
MSLTLLSPFAGTIHPIEEAPDPVFSMKMLGDGFFVTPSSNDVFSPVDGEITYVAPTKHGIRINAADGTKMTLHIGTESGELKGEGFTVFVAEGAKVKQGDKLMTFSPELLRQNPKTTDACIVLIEELPEGKEVRLTTGGEVAPLAAVAEIV